MIRVSNIVKYYGSGESRAQVLKGIDAEIAEGEFAVILGASGSGKTTLLNVLSGLERPDAGAVVYGETDITALNDRELTEFRRKVVGFVFSSIIFCPT